MAGKSGICATSAMAAAFACLTAPSALAQSEGGAVFTERPKVTKVECLRACASRGRAQSGSTLRVRGRALSGVDSMTFHGANGRGDDARSKVRSGSATRINVKVPVGASTGPVSVHTKRPADVRAHQAAGHPARAPARAQPRPHPRPRPTPGRRPATGDGH